MKKFSGVLLMALAIIILALSINSCTRNQRARNWGGNADITLPEDQKLINVTWKENNLWYLTRPMRPYELPETYVFAEESSWGLMEGTYTITEIKSKK